MSPILLIYWFKEFSKNYNFYDGLLFLVIALILVVFLYIILKMAKSKLETISISISEISNADNESVIPIFLYLIPLLYFDNFTVAFLFILFLAVISTTYINPILGLMGYRQYKVKLSSGVSYILITRKTLINTKQVKEVVQLTNYILLEKENDK
jgi:membrane protein implicated in regulation of membrane protease activity